MILPIKKQWFDMIIKGIKKEEYREIKPYYISRLEKFLDQDLEIILRNGYSSKSPSIKCRCHIKKGVGKEEWGAEKNKEYYVLEILSWKK